MRPGGPLDSTGPSGRVLLFRVTRWLSHTG